MICLHQVHLVKFNQLGPDETKVRKKNKSDAKVGCEEIKTVPQISSINNGSFVKQKGLQYNIPQLKAG